MVGTQVGLAWAAEGRRSGLGEAKTRVEWGRWFPVFPPDPTPGHHGAPCSPLYCTHSTDEKAEAQSEQASCPESKRY